MYTLHGDFSSPVERKIDGLACLYWTNAKGRVLNFCTHTGDHSFSVKHVETVWKMLMKTGARRPK